MCVYIVVTDWYPVTALCRIKYVHKKKIQETLKKFGGVEGK